VGNPGFLETIYGILFDPVRTFRRLADAPPLLLTFAIVTLVNAFGALMSILTVRTVGLTDVDPEIAQVVSPAAPFLILAGFFLWYAKWLGYGAVLHLTAQLLGGSGGARGTLVTYGLAGLPAILLLPVDALVVVANLGQSPVTVLLGLLRLAVFVWGVVLLVIGLREMHRFPTGRAVTTVLAPVGAVVLLVIVLLIISLSGFAAMSPVWPGLPAEF
jgi:hypothetical protein